MLETITILILEIRETINQVIRRYIQALNFEKIDSVIMLSEKDAKQRNV